MREMVDAGNPGGSVPEKCKDECNAALAPFAAWWESFCP